MSIERPKSIEKDEHLEEKIDPAELAKEAAKLGDKITGGIKVIVRKLRERVGRKEDEEEPNQWGSVEGVGSNAGLPADVTERLEGTRRVPKEEIDKAA